MSSTTDRSQSRGQVLVLFAGGLAALMLVAALAFDVGMMLAERRDEQNAADAAALAGARYLSPDQLPAEVAAATAAARAIALANGYDDAHADQVVLIHIPPIHGQYASRPGMIEVQIENTRQSIFGGIIGRSVWPVGASAVATNAQNLTFPFSMLALNPTECKAIAVSGGGVIEAYANIQSNSNGSECTTGEATGFSRTGGATINVVAPDATCRVVGDFQDQGSGPPITCTIAENSFALPDPLRNLAAPVMPALAPPMQFVGDPAGEPADQPKHCPGRDDSDAPNPDNPSMCVLGSPSGSCIPGSIRVGWGSTPARLRT